MAEIIRMPRMSDTMEEGVIVGWEKKVGDTIEPGDVLAEIETDKATMEFESVFEGVLLHIEVAEGAVPIDGVIAIIGEKGEDVQAALKMAKDNNVESNGSSVVSSADPAPAPVAEPAMAPTSQVQTLERIKASPLAKSMASQAGIDLATLQGSGDHGRIIKRDIEAVIDKQEQTPVAVSSPEIEAPASPAFSYEPGGDQFVDHPVSQMRKTIARRLGESKFSAPHFYLTIDVDMANVKAMRKEVNTYAPTKISFNDFVIKATAAALRKHPAVNSSWMETYIRQNHNINIGVAVAVEDGLLVPVVRFADIKSLSQINMEVKDFAGRARDKKLQLPEMQGNTFTISNLGMFGIQEFTAIINPPDSCIMAVGAIEEKPVVVDGELTVGSRMKVTLSCDHRVVDGATGAQFLQTFKEILENPIRLLV